MYDGISIGTIQRRRRAPVERFLELEVYLPTQNDQLKLNDISTIIQKEINELRESGKALKKFSDHLNDYWLSGSY
jgi:hypothetical protein